MQAGNTAGSLKAQSHHKIYTSNRESVGLDLLGKTGHTRTLIIIVVIIIIIIIIYIYMHIMISLDSHLSLSRSTVYVQYTYSILTYLHFHHVVRSGAPVEPLRCPQPSASPASHDLWI
jgi:hypothetical protein